MEEDAAVKAPVTRLRRRLSVEQPDEVKSPSAPSTPSKKRGRLAAKPQLELIEENSDNVPKKGGKKTAAKEVIEASEEKPLTPSRRSTRIKSNTSIISDTPQNVDSPRAKRAARRLSQVGSDNEAPPTPVRQTRRTRKDSTSSVDKLDTASVKSTSIAEPIVEEIENSQKSNNKNEITPENSSQRKSPRLIKKKLNSSKSYTDSNKTIEDTESQISEAVSETPVYKDINNSKPTPDDVRTSTDNEEYSTNIKTKNDYLSESTRELIENIDVKQSQKSKMNKSTSSVENVNMKNKRSRTKSLTATSASIENDSNFYSDNENTKKKTKIVNIPINSDKFIKTTVVGNLWDKSVNNESNNNELDIQENITSSSKKQKTNSNVILLGNRKSENFNTSESEKDRESLKNISQHLDLNETSKIIEKPPVAVIQSIVYFDDSDTGSTGKPSSQNKIDNEDQCVPVIVNHFEEVVVKSCDIDINGIHENIKNTSGQINENQPFNNSCEPMDVDETMPTNISIIDSSNNKLDIEKHESLSEHQNDSLKHKSSQLEQNASKSINKTKRETLHSTSLSQNADTTTENENKSTLLSQIKDVYKMYTTPENSISKSRIKDNDKLSAQIKDVYKQYTTPENSISKSRSEDNDKLSKSVDNEKPKSSDNDKKNLSLNYTTSTPLQQKNIKKLAMQINTSIINSELKKITPNKNKLDKSAKKDRSKSSNMSLEADSSEEDASEENFVGFVETQAEEASDSYESGDSLDEDERQYQKENEIVEKGETLSSEGEVSDDTDYEKDSFVVSSNEEDNDLLSGSGDDLSLSNNELTMSKKSKTKYNKRKTKEQKQASKEMFEARHNISNNSSKSDTKKPKKKNRLRLDSSTLDSDEEIAIGSKKKNRLRLESSQECSIIESDMNDSKKKKKRLSESAGYEFEITTTCNESVLEKNDPLVIEVKPEPQTPMKELNISTVPINDNIEEIQLDNNVSIMKTNETSDPLQEEESNASSISENMEITENYDSLLQGLNKEMGNKKTKLDMSLNLNKKKKSKQNEPLVDELNLTQSKPKKHETLKVGETKKKVKKQKEALKISFDCDSSDSIDFKLLFSEDSGDGAQKTQVQEETLIPLKRTAGKTNITEDNEPLEDTPSLTDSSKKNKKRLSSMSIKDEQNSQTGLNTSVSAALNTSTKKNKKNSISIADENEVEIQTKKKEVMDVSLNTSGKKKKKNSMSLSGVADYTDGQRNNDDDTAIMFIDTKGNGDESISTSGKKKKKHSQSFADNPEYNVDANNEKDRSITMFIDTKGNRGDESISASGKKKKHTKSFADNTEYDVDANTEKDRSITMFIDTKGNKSITDASFNITEKKNKKKKSMDCGDNSGLSETDENIDKSIHMFIDTKGNRSDISISENTSAKKKKKKRKSLSNVECGDTNVEVSPNVDALTDKIQAVENLNKSNVSLNTSKRNMSVKDISKQDIQNDSDDAPEEISYQTHKNITPKHQKDDIQIFVDTVGEHANLDLNTSSSSKKKKNKKKRSSITETEIIGISDNTNSIQDVNLDLNTTSGSSSKKNKKKRSSITETEIIVISDNTNPIQDGNDLNTTSSSSSKKKKNKKKRSAITETEIIGISDNTNSIQDVKSTKLNVSNIKNVESTIPEPKNKVNEPEVDGESGNSKKRKRKLSAVDPAASEGDKQKSNVTIKDNEFSVGNKKKKPKISEPEYNIVEQKDEAATKKQSKKRKERDDDDSDKAAKMHKHSNEKINVPRLPDNILDQLDERPSKETLKTKKSIVMATTHFIVEEGKRRKNKPSNYLEESVYLNNSHDENTQTRHIKIPKVLPFVPTASTSGSGFTTKFVINVIPKETKFVAQTSNLAGFKNEYLQTQKMLKNRSQRMTHKAQRIQKLRKF